MHSYVVVIFGASWLVGLTSRVFSSGFFCSLSFGICRPRCASGPDVLRCAPQPQRPSPTRRPLRRRRAARQWQRAPGGFSTCGGSGRSRRAKQGPVCSSDTLLLLGRTLASRGGVASGHGFVGLGGAGARSGGVAQSTLPRLQQRSLRYEAPLHRGEFLGAVAERCLCVIAKQPAASLAALVPDMLERGASAWPQWGFYVCGAPRKSLSPTAHEESCLRVAGGSPLCRCDEVVGANLSPAIAASGIQGHMGKVWRLLQVFH